MARSLLEEAGSKQLGRRGSLEEANSKQLGRRSLVEGRPLGHPGSFWSPFGPRWAVPGAVLGPPEAFLKCVEQLGTQNAENQKMMVSLKRDNCFFAAEVMQIQVSCFEVCSKKHARCEYAYDVFPNVSLKLARRSMLEVNRVS